MGNKRRLAYRNRHKGAKRDRHPAAQPPEPASPFLCGTCGYQGIDAYDISTHLRDSSTYCGSTTNITEVSAAAPSSPPDDSSCPPEEGDSFMYEDENDDEDIEHSVSPENASSAGGGESSSLLGSVSSASLSSPADTIGADDDSDTSLKSDDSDTAVKDDESDTGLVNVYEFYEEESFPSGVDDVVHVELADLCRRIRAPLYAYNEILRWAQNAKGQGYSFPVDAPQYSTFISTLKKRLNIEDYVHKTSTVEAAGGGTVSFPVFDFRSMFVSLIDDPRMKDHLLVNWEEPSSPPPFDGGRLDEIHSGMWHQRTSEKLIKNNSDEILCGIILFIDRTHVADKDKLSLEPVLFSLSIIPRALRNHPFAWRPLGFIPKFSTSKSLGSNAQTYHRVLGTILSGLVRAQNNGGIKCCVLAGQLDAEGAEREFCFKVPLAFVIGDVEGHDVLCARYHTHNTKMLSRECNCSMEDADNHQVDCKYIRASDLTRLRESDNKTALKELCFHNVRNAFDNVCFGANEYGIHRATMSEVLHAIQKGWYVYTLSGLYGMLSGKPMGFLDSLARRISRQCRHQSDRDFPRLSFPNGITSYKLLHAHEMSGLLLLLTICLYCHLGWDKNHEGDITANSFVRNRNCFSKRSRLKQFRDLLEMLLCMEAWMKQDSVDRKVVSPRQHRNKPYESAGKEALRIAMSKYVKVVSRKEGHGLKHVKTHSVLHIPDDILWFGSPNNWNSARNESGHITHAKVPAELTQGRKATLEDQVSGQTTNLLALTTARDLIWKSKNYLGGEGNNVSVMTTNHSPNFNVENRGSRFLVKVSQSGTCWVAECIEQGKGESKKKSKTTLSCTRLFENLVYDGQMKFLAGIFYQALRDGDSTSPVSTIDIPCFTEIKVVHNHVAQIYRGHPAYRGEDPWHDWVNVKWKGLDGRMSKVPAEIQFFVDVNEKAFPFARNIKGYRGEGTYAVMQSMIEEPNPHGTSMLLSKGAREMDAHLNHVFQFERVDSFVSPAFVVDNIGCPRQTLLVLTPRSEWAKLFL